MDNKDKDFTGYRVYRKTDPEHITGMKVIKTNKWLRCGNPDSTLYEVKLENGRLYQLLESEMIKEHK